MRYQAWRERDPAFFVEIIYLSHCVPNPPDKGERVRAYHEVRFLASRYRVHVVCFAKNSSEQNSARELEGACASVMAEKLPPTPSLARALASFAFGACLNTSYYDVGAVRRHLQRLTDSHRPAATVVFSSAVAPLAPPQLPLFLDMVDLDSEKWLQYAAARRPSWLFAAEGNRLRKVEAGLASRAAHVWLTTGNEVDLYRKIAPAASVTAMENGVDSAYFNPETVLPDPSLAGRKYVVFVGTMDYYPNHDAAWYFATEILPELRRRAAALELLVVGRNPNRKLLGLHGRDGVAVTGAVPDVRPYLLHAQAFVAPLRIARGIQNKVLEALAMGCPVLASEAVIRTFGGDPPAGVRRCDTAADHADGLVWADAADHGQIRAAAGQRFDWNRNLEPLARALDRLRA